MAVRSMDSCSVAAMVCSSADVSARSEEDELLDEEASILAAAAKAWRASLSEGKQQKKLRLTDV